MIVFECPSCKTKLQAADEHAGKSVKCPTCQNVAPVPVSVDQAAEGVTAAPGPSAPPPPNAVTTPETAQKSKRGRDEDDDDRPRRKRGDDDDDDDDDRPRRRRRDRAPAPSKGMSGLAVAAIVLGVGCCVAGPILVALLVPAVQRVREAAARTQSINNLKSIGLGFHAFHDVNKHMPYNGTRPAVGNDPTSGSWAFQILPFVEQQNVFATANRNAGIITYMCPGRGRPSVEMGGGAWTDYFYNNYLNDPDRAAQPNAPDRKRSLVAITDGSSNTIMLGHGNIATTQYSSFNNVTLSTNIFMGGTPGTMRAGNNGRVSPAGCRLTRDSPAPPTIGSWGGPFPQGAMMAMGDGTVRMFPYSMINVGDFLTPDGGEAIVLPDF